MYEIINGSIELDKPLLLIDTSFLIFARFFSLRIWYKNAHKDKEIKSDHDWLKDPIFMEKYEKLFFDKILKICKKQKIPHCNIIFAFDCSSKNNWRKKINTEYKGTRAESHRKNNFTAFELFNIAKNDYIKKFCASNKALAFYHNELEADDIVSFIARYYYNNTEINKIFIVANDHDYLQICNSIVNLIDLSQKYISQHITTPNEAIKYLVSKLFIGDTSDNISSIYISTEFLKNYIASIKTKNNFVKASKKIVETIINNSEMLTYILNIMDTNRKNKYNHKAVKDTISKDNQFSNNQILIDMEMIPYCMTTCQKLN